MQKRVFGLILILILVLSMVPDTVLAATVGSGLHPRTGDFSNIWGWVALATVGIIGFGIVLYLLLAPKKKGNYEREEEKK